MITFPESDYTFPGCDAQERPPFNVFWHSIAFNPVRAPEGAWLFLRIWSKGQVLFY